MQRLIGFVPWIYALAFIACGAFGAAFTYGFFKGLDPLAFASLFSAFASLLVAGGTILLAWYTSGSVRATQAILENQATNFRKAQTVALINQYNQVPLQLNSDIAVTPYNAFCEIVNFAEQPEQARFLKEFYNSQRRESEADDNRRKQYRALVECFPTILNFYMHAEQLYAEDVLDKQMFVNRFSPQLLLLCEAMPKLNAVIQAVTPESLERLAPLKTICQDWIERKSGRSRAAPPSG